MGRRSLACMVLAIVPVLAISGCQSVPKKFKEEVSGIKTRVDTLETRVEGVESKQATVERAAIEQNQAIEELKSKRERVAETNVSIKPRFSRTREGIKEIQTCLKNAGFYNGKIDGIKGKGTKRAIKEFQSANGLKADGIVGKKTWELLSKYEPGAGVVQTEGGEEGAVK